MLPTRVVAKPWGRINLPAPFANSGAEPIGEIWFEPPAELDSLLVKYIFTSENLSVQCHPSDDQTVSKGLGRQGKEECWLVLSADPGARLAIGFKQEIDEEAMRSAALDGTIENLLNWHPVNAGDFFYIPANTVHAIGAGITLVEVQQNSDITYRLYDYGRPRELHIDEGMSVALGAPYPAHLRKRIEPKGSIPLVDGPYFRLDRLDGVPDAGIESRYLGQLFIIPLDCGVTVGGEAIEPGECALAGSLEVIDFPASGRCLIAQSV